MNFAPLWPVGARAIDFATCFTDPLPLAHAAAALQEASCARLELCAAGSALAQCIATTAPPHAPLLLLLRYYDTALRYARAARAVFAALENAPPVRTHRPLVFEWRHRLFHASSGSTLFATTSVLLELVAANTAVALAALNAADEERCAQALQLLHYNRTALLPRAPLCRPLGTHSDSEEAEAVAAHEPLEARLRRRDRRRPGEEQRAPVLLCDSLHAALEHALRGSRCEARLRAAAMPPPPLRVARASFRALEHFKRAAAALPALEHGGEQAPLCMRRARCNGELFNALALALQHAFPLRAGLTLGFSREAARLLRGDAALRARVAALEGALKQDVARAAAGVPDARDIHVHAVARGDAFAVVEVRTGVYDVQLPLHRRNRATGELTDTSDGEDIVVARDEEKQEEGEAAAAAAAVVEELVVL